MAPAITVRSLALLALEPEQLRDTMLYAALLGLVLIVAAIAIALASRYRRNTRNECLTPSDQLAQFRSLYEQGAISQEEFDRLKGLLGGQLRQALNVPVKPPHEGGKPAGGLPPVTENGTPPSNAPRPPEP